MTELTNYIFFIPKTKFVESKIYVSFFINDVFVVDTYSVLVGDNKFKISLPDYICESLGMSDCIRVEKDGIVIFEEIITTDKNSSFNNISKMLKEGYVVGTKGKLRFKAENRDSWLPDHLEFAAYATNKFSNILGFNIFMCHGTLLGAIRENRIMSMDHDLDFAFALESKNDLLFKKDYYDVIKKLIASGEDIRLFEKNGKFRSNFFMWYKKGSNVKIDIFPVWCSPLKNKIIGSFTIYGDGGIQDIYPLCRHQLNDYTFYKPTNSELILEYIYGADWRIPDPLWKKWPLDQNTKAQLKLLDLTRDYQQSLVTISSRMGLDTPKNIFNNNFASITHSSCKSKIIVSLNQTDFFDDKLLYAFYLYRDNICVKKTKYNTPSSFEFEIDATGGCYHSIIFRKNKSGQIEMLETGFISFNVLD